MPNFHVFATCIFSSKLPLKVGFAFLLLAVPAMHVEHILHVQSLDSETDRIHSCFNVASAISHCVLSCLNFKMLYLHSAFAMKPLSNHGFSPSMMAKRSKF